MDDIPQCLNLIDVTVSWDKNTKPKLSQTVHAMNLWQK